MSAIRPLFRSPKFAEGITSEAIEESGVKVCMFAIGRGSGVARRLESVPEDANEPIDLSILKTGRTTATAYFQNIPPLFSRVVGFAFSLPDSAEHFGQLCAERF